MKKWVSAGILLLLAVLSRGLILAVVFGVPAALDVMIAVNRDRRYKFVPWPVTRRIYRWLFVSPAPPGAPPLPPVMQHHHHGMWHEHINGHIPHEHASTSLVTPGIPPPTGERHSRYIPNDVKAAVMRRDMGRCQRCGSTEDIQYDHVHPWSKGGTATVRNIQLLCGPCNRRKRDR